MFAEHEVVTPPFVHIHDHVHGPDHDTADEAHDVHRFVGIDQSVFPLSVPHTPSDFFGAEQYVVVPLFAPRQLHE